MNCWICGEEGNTGEHIPKASDLRSYFGLVSQVCPIYFHSKTKPNIPIKSIKSDRFKSKAKICSHCNNTLTQPYDRSWEVFSEYLTTHSASLRRYHKIRLSKVFHQNVTDHSIDMHLYFVKIFGCLIAEHDIPIDIAPLATSLLNRIPHKNIHIGFGSLTTSLNNKCMTVTDLNAVCLQRAGFTEKVVFGAWMYTIGNIGINIIFNEVANNDEVLADSWHPSIAPSKIITFKTFSHH